MNRRDLIVAALLALVALAVYTTGRNNEFQGDDDPAYASNMALFSDLALGLPEAVRCPIAYAKALVQRTLCSTPHGLLPTALYGLAWALFSLAGVPFTLATLHAPLAVAAAGTVALMYAVLRLAGARRGLAALGAMLLLASPLFAMEARGLATFFGVAIPLGQLIGLAGLGALQRGCRWPAGLALLWTCASDVLFLPSLAALVGAWSLRAPAAYAGVRTPGEAVRRAWGQLAELRRPAVLLPPLVMIGTIAAGTVAAILQAPRWTWPLRTQVLRLLAHRGESGSALLEPAWIPKYAVMWAGELFPLALLAVLAWTVARRRLPTGFVPAWCLCAGGGYLLVWIGLAAPNRIVQQFYQIYLVVPTVLAFTLCLERLIAESSARAAPVAVLCAVLVASELAASTSFVLQKPWTLWPAAYAGWIHGVNAADRGSRAIGYLVRTILIEEGIRRRRVATAIEGSGASYSLSMFSGLRIDGGFYAREVGIDAPLRPAWTTAESPDEPMRVRLVFPGTGPARTFRVVDGARPLGEVIVLGDTTAPEGVAPGTIDRARLEELYAARYETFAHFFPRTRFCP